jgi:hypothetical protein
MSAKPFRLMPYGFLACCFAISSTFLGTNFLGKNLHENRALPSPGLTAHEWGTFTSIAGNDGQAAEWLPLSGSTDLPGFVKHFRNAGFKRGLRGTVRMETPVLYFYSAREATVAVKVAFSKGVITEWYPDASRVGPTATLTDASLKSGNNLGAKQADGSIAWDAVTLEPGAAADLLREKRDNPYYAARETSSTPLRVKTSAGEQQEKFLFYRGVSIFPVPISATLTPEGKVRVENRGKDAIPNVILFERRGEKLGYRIGGAVQNEAILDAPALTGTSNSLGKDLEEMLVAQGLYQDEAQAMVRTWRQSWFEEGSRLLYIVPARFVDTVLPLAINPAPSQRVRVFVGRMELVTPATRKAVETAFATHDGATLKMYGRFLEPILQTMVQGETNPARAQRLQGYLQSVYSTEIAQARRGN